MISFGHGGSGDWVVVQCIAKLHLHDSGTFFLFGSSRFALGEKHNGAAHEWVNLPHRLDRRDHGGPLALGPSLVTVRRDGPMTSLHPGPAPVASDAGPASLIERIRYLEWSPVVAGAIAAAALALVLQAFALAIGLSVSSTAPTWRDASFALVLLSGLYLVLAALASYGLGGYLAGLMRARLTSREDADLRDGLHGLLVWALATLLAAAIGLATAQSLTRLAAPSGGQAGSSTSVAGENLIAYDLDRLFRAERRPNGDLDYARAEAARILLTASSHRGLQPEDRAYLIRLTAAYTGLAQPDAERRVDEAIAHAKENISRARRSAVILAFMTGAAAMVGAAACWFAACAGGRVRDGEVLPHALLDWGRPVRRS
jgi:hypothetical protein